MFLAEAKESHKWDHRSVKRYDANPDPASDVMASQLPTPARGFRNHLSE